MAQVLYIQRPPHETTADLARSYAKIVAMRANHVQRGTEIGMLHSVKRERSMRTALLLTAVCVGALAFVAGMSLPLP